jgi:hypothetical protein
MEFKDLCTGSEYEKTLDSIMTRLQDGDSYEWENKLAFNLWCKWSYDYKNASNYQLPVLIKQHLNMIDRSSLIPLPDYAIKAIQETESKPSIEKKKAELAKLKQMLKNT